MSTSSTERVFCAHGDPVLQTMAEAAKGFMLELNDPKAKPRWISFLGGTGTGKTFIAELIFEHARKRGHLVAHPTLLCGVEFVFWLTLLRRTRCRIPEDFELACEVNLLVLDELRHAHDPSGFANDTLFELLAVRLNKWTVITSNLTLGGIEKLSAPVASRMVRSPNIVVSCETMDYALRMKGVAA